jgi:hypothetical protein
MPLFRVRIVNCDGEPVYSQEVEADSREDAVEEIDIEAIRDDLGFDDLTIGEVKEIKQY